MIQSTLNRILNLNPDYLTYLEDVAGLSITLDLIDVRFKRKIIFHHSFIEVTAEVGDSQLELTGKLIDFITFALKKNQRQKLLQASLIDFKGDLMVLQQLEAFLNHFDMQRLVALPISQIKRFLTNEVEYLQEERHVLASPHLFAYFQEEVLDLQQKLERLAFRSERMVLIIK